MSTATVAERVAKGAALMDERVPGWERMIDIGHFSMSSCCDCVIGQVFGVEAEAAVVGVCPSTVYSDKLIGLGLLGHGEKLLGFNADSLGPDRQSYYELRTAWLAEIDRRLTTEGGDA